MSCGKRKREAHWRPADGQGEASEIIANAISGDIDEIIANGIYPSDDMKRGISLDHLAVASDSLFNLVVVDPRG
eukprot:8657349-Pyramimonas_sp.AAC.1